MASAVIGALRVLLSADTAAFATGLNKANRLAGNFSQTASRAFSRLGVAIAAVAGPAAIGLLVRSTMEAIDAQAKLADRVGSSVKAIQTLEHAANLAGVSQEQLAKTLEMLNARLGEAARTGAGPAAEALDRLGLSAQSLINLDADERLATLSDRFKELGLNAAQQADSLRQMGIRSQEIINLLQEGRPAIEAAARDMEAFGIAVTDVEASQIEAANDALSRIGLVLQGIGTRLAVEVSPLIEEVANRFVDAAAEAGGFDEVIKRVVRFFVAGFYSMRDTVNEVRIVIDELIAGVLDLFDAIAGAPPNFLAHVFGGTAEDYGFRPINQAFGNLRDEIGTPPGIEEWDAWFADLQAKAANTNFWNQANAAYFGDPPPVDLELGGRIQSIRDSLRSQREVLTEAYETQHADLQAALAADLLTQEEYNTLQGQLLAEHNAKLAEIDAAGRASGGAADAEHRAQQLLALQESLMSEQELEVAAYEQKLADLDAFFAEGLIRQEEYNRLRQGLEEQHNEEMARLREEDVADQKRADEIKRESALGAASALAGGLSNLFKENKALAIATALINTYEAVTRNLAKYEGPIGVAYAAAALANGLAQVRAITSTNKGSKGGGGGGLSTAGVPGFGAAGGEAGGASVPSRTLFVSGINPSELYRGDAMRGLAEQLIEFQRNGGEIVLK